jgi:phage shock protein A
MGILRRIANLFSGFLSLFVGGVERRNPAIAYENAINALTKKYVALKQATAAVIARRDAIERRLVGEREQLRLTEGDLDSALNQGQDDVAVVLLQRKESLTGEIVELEAEFQESTEDSDEAKTSLNALKAEVTRLKDERDRVIAKLKSAEARIAVQNQLDGLAVDAELKALEGVRENVTHRIAESKLNKELKESNVETKIATIREIGSKERALKALEDIKRARPQRALTAGTRTMVIEAELDKVLVSKE